MWRKHVFMDQATDGTQGGGAGAEPAAAAPAAAPATAGSALATGQASVPASPAAPAAGPNDWIPEKHRVSKADGSIDFEASARKVADAYQHLEQRLGTGDIPPKTPEEYDIKGLPEAIKIDDLKADPEMKGFLKAAHAKGLTNDQVSFVLNEYMTRAPNLVDSGQKLTADETTQALRDVWKNESEFGQNMGHAYRAASAIAGKVGISFEQLEQSGLGNHPVFIRLMAALGPEMNEDSVTSGGAGSVSAGDFDAQVSSIRANPAFNDAKHPEHKTLMARMDQLYAKRFGTKPQKLFSGVGH